SGTGTDLIDRLSKLAGTFSLAAKAPQPSTGAVVNLERVLIGHCQFTLLQPGNRHDGGFAQFTVGVVSQASDVHNGPGNHRVTDRSPVDAAIEDDLDLGTVPAYGLLGGDPGPWEHHHAPQDNCHMPECQDWMCGTRTVSSHHDRRAMAIPLTAESSDPPAPLRPAHRCALQLHDRDRQP